MQPCYCGNMERKRFTDHPCPIARAADLFGDWWIPMILREAMYGVEQFSAFQANLDISRNILTQRLRRLVEEGVMSKEGQRYVLTEKGRSALDILGAMAAWSNRWVFSSDEAPIQLRDRATGELVEAAVVNRSTGEPIRMEELIIEPGPGFPQAAETRALRFGSQADPFAR